MADNLPAKHEGTIVRHEEGRKWHGRFFYNCYSWIIGSGNGAWNSLCRVRLFAQSRISFRESLRSLQSSCAICFVLGNTFNPPDFSRPRDLWGKRLERNGRIYPSLSIYWILWFLKFINIYMWNENSFWIGTIARWKKFGQDSWVYLFDETLRGNLNEYPFHVGKLEWMKTRRKREKESKMKMNTREIAEIWHEFYY